MGDRTTPNRMGKVSFDAWERVNKIDVLFKLVFVLYPYFGFCSPNSLQSSGSLLTPPANLKPNEPSELFENSHAILHRCYSNPTNHSRIKSINNKIDGSNGTRWRWTKPRAHVFNATTHVEKFDISQLLFCFRYQVLPGKLFSPSIDFYFYQNAKSKFRFRFWLQIRWMYAITTQPPNMCEREPHDITSDTVISDRNHASGTKNKNWMHSCIRPLTLPAYQTHTHDAPASCHNLSLVFFFFIFFFRSSSPPPSSASCIFIDPITTGRIKSIHHKNVGIAYIRNLISVYISNFDWVERQTWKYICACECERVWFWWETTFDRNGCGYCSMLSRTFSTLGLSFGILVFSTMVDLRHPSGPHLPSCRGCGGNTSSPYIRVLDFSSLFPFEEDFDARRWGRTDKGYHLRSESAKKFRQRIFRKSFPAC